MAEYKYDQILTRVDHAEFDHVFEPGTTTAWSGIYRCEGCTREIVHTTAHQLPPLNHHQHTTAQGRIRWRLIVTDSVS
jgi:hypothetical protein